MERLMIIFVLGTLIFLESLVLYYVFGNEGKIKKKIIKNIQCEITDDYFKPKENVIYKIHCPTIKEIRNNVENVIRVAPVVIFFNTKEIREAIYFVNAIPCDFAKIIEGDFATFKYEQYYDILYFNKNYVCIRFKNIEKFSDMYISSGGAVEKVKCLDSSELKIDANKIRITRALNKR